MSEDLSLDALTRIDEACDRFEAQWLKGERPCLETYMQESPEAERAELLRALLKLDLCYRRRCETPVIEDYLPRFPEYAVVVRDLVCEHQPTSLGDTARAAPSSGSDTIPSIPGYEIVEMIGRGGMGVVYKARQLSLGRVVALKMILDGQQADPEQRSRFHREAEAVARLQHPNIVSIYEIGEHQGRPYIALEYVKGSSLDRMLAGQPQSPTSAAEMIMTLARAMQTAHEQGIIHRDLKPANVLLSDSGSPKITDFGLARHIEADVSNPTQTGALVGTPSYMAPEQASGQIHLLGPATDVYALGATLYEMLTGHPPFQGDNLLETIEQIRFHDPTPLRGILSQCPRDLESICMKCLDKDPLHRYQTAAALADDLERFLQGEPIQAKSYNWVNRLARMLGRSHLDNQLHNWANLLLFFAAVIFASQTATFLAFEVQSPKSGMVLIRVAQIILMLVGLWWFRPEGLLPRTQAERQLFSIWLGYILATTFSAAANRLIHGEEKMFQAALYPMWTAMSGMGFFAMGSTYWGGCYVIGIAFFALALLMPMHVDWAPFTFGVLWGIVLTCAAYRLRSLSLARQGRTISRSSSS